MSKQLIQDYESKSICPEAKHSSTSCIYSTSYLFNHNFFYFNWGAVDVWYYMFQMYSIVIHSF